jgi:hypothetical protein
MPIDNTPKPTTPTTPAAPAAPAVAPAVLPTPTLDASALAVIISEQVNQALAQRLEDHASAVRG